MDGADDCRKGRPNEIQVWNQACIEINWISRILRWFHVGIPAIFMYVSLHSPNVSERDKGNELTVLVRFWGTRENAREVEKDQRELSELAKAGKSVYGETDMSEYLQGVASRNSTWSQLKLHAMPW
jgi:hypothetical protein